MLVKRPIVPDFIKCRAEYGWDYDTIFRIADNLNDIHGVKARMKIVGVQRIKHALR